MTFDKQKQTPLEYLNTLIEEYYVACMRRRVYSKLKDKTYWRKVASFKAEKIYEIMSRNPQLPNLFDDVIVKQQYDDKFYPTGEIPKVILTELDLKLYYSVGADVWFKKHDQKVWFGRITFRNISTKEVTVLCNDTQEPQDLRFEDIRRII